jgi:hypothetical protein
LASKLVVTVSGGLASKPVVTVSSGLASKPATTVSSGLDSKLVATVSGGLASKPAVMVFWFRPQNRQLRFGDLGLKIIVTVSCFVSQKQAAFGLSVAPQNRQREVSVGHASRSSDLLHVKASLARVSQSGLKTGGGVTVGDARGTIAEVMSESN